MFRVQATGTGTIQECVITTHKRTVREECPFISPEKSPNLAICNIKIQTSFILVQVESPKRIVEIDPSIKLARIVLITNTRLCNLKIKYM